MMGMVTEYKVAAYYTSLGYTVYWCLESQSADDFVIRKDSTFKRVQVKTATWSRVGNYDYLQCRLGHDARQRGIPKETKGCKYTKDDYDIIAFLSPEGRLWLAPIEEVQSSSNICLATTNPQPRKSSKPYDPSTWENTLV